MDAPGRTPGSPEAVPLPMKRATRPLLQWVPVDVLCIAFQFLDTQSLGIVSMVSKELRAAAEATAVVSFRQWFGADPPPQLPRSRLLLFVDQVRSCCGPQALAWAVCALLRNLALLHVVAGTAVRACLRLTPALRRLPVLRSRLRIRGTTPSCACGPRSTATAT